MAEFTLTIRKGPEVAREQHETLCDAIEALSASVAAVRSEGALPSVTMLRTFEPGQRVRARVEISTGRLFRRREAGVDVMGDGSVVPFSGGSTREHLDPRESESFEDVVAAALRE
jgi:hypothetical protein